MFPTTFSLILFCTFLLACNGDGRRNEKHTKDSANSSGFSGFFTKSTLPYQLADTGLINTAISKEQAYDFSNFIADSTLNKVFGRNTSLKFTPIVYLTNSDSESFYIVQASSSKKKAAFLLAYDAGGAFGASTPFLIPDHDPNTMQATTIDKSFTITKTIVRKDAAGIIAEGKEVINYEPATKSFPVIMLDALDDNPDIVNNPIDTFSKTNKLAGDYVLNKKNIVSIRDGRITGQLLVFIHTENETGDCIGHLKAEFIMTSSSTAAYRQPGDPCVLNLLFKGNTVSLSEESGCGNYRGLDCVFSGIFTRKKSQPVRSSSVKAKSK